MLRSGAVAVAAMDRGGHRHDSLGKRAIAFEQASVYLPSSDAAQLGVGCWTLQAFLDGAHRVGAYWLLQLGAARGRYEDGVAWLHALADSRTVAAFAEEIRRVKVPSQLEFHSSSVLRACTAAMASAGDRPYDFAVTWRFAPISVCAFLEGAHGGQEPLLSEALRFECSHGFAFSIALALSRRRHSPGLMELRLGSIEVIGGALPPGLEIRASGTVPAVRAMGHMQADLLPVKCGGLGGSGVRPHPIMLWLGEEQCEEFLQHHQLISLVCIDVGVARGAHEATVASPPAEEQEAWVRPLAA